MRLTPLEIVHGTPPCFPLLSTVSRSAHDVLSPSLFAYQSAWQKEADELIEGERLVRKANGKVY